MSLIGIEIDGRYRLESELGRGGMGVVYRAFDTTLARYVALKILSEKSLGSEGRNRMLLEAQAAAGLNHPNIVQVFDAGETKQVHSDESTPYIVMELVEGSSLFEQLPIDLERVIPLALQICQALNHAHKHGIIHRDLKPENILISTDGKAKLMDFGLARSLASRLTSEGQIVGTVFYLAPELALSQPFDGRADLYSLGVLLYELATTRLPFEADDPIAVVSQHIHAPIVPPRAHNQDLPRALENLISSLLEKDPGNRPTDAEEVLQSLKRIERDPVAGISELETGEISFLDRIVRGRLVGRSRDLADAKVLWQKAVDGLGQVLLVSGEPGIGKTRFVRELRTLAEVSGGKALAGACFPEGGAPYAPFAQIVTAELQNRQNHTTPDYILDDLLNLAPSLRPMYPDVAPNPALDPQAEQYRLYENMFLFMAQQSGDRPLHLIFEDVHWADSGTLAMIRHLARRAKEQRILLVATYREVEIDQSRPLNRFLLDLNRERLAHRIKLVRLDKQDTARLLEAILAEKITPEFLEAIFRETEGNPFFIEEVCKALIDSGKLYFQNGRWHRPKIAELEIPQSIRISIQSRLGFLRPEVYDVMLLAAALGRSFDYETLHQVSGQPEPALIESLEVAERAQLIEEIGASDGGTFAFSHALIPATMLEGVSGLRRRRLHRQVLDVLSVQRPKDLDTLAHHAFSSGDQRRGLQYAVEAGEQALQVHAVEEAEQDFLRALEAAEQLNHTESLKTIHQRLGDVYTLQGNLSAAVRHFEAALNYTEGVREQAVLKAKIGDVHTMAGDASGQEILLEALEDLDPELQAGPRAVALANLGRTYHLQGQHRKAIHFLEEAMDIGQALDEPQSLTSIYGYLAGAYQHLAEIDKSLKMADHLIQTGERLDYPYATAMGYEFMAEDYLIKADWQRGMKYGILNREMGEKLGALDRVAWAEFSISGAHFGMGELAEARDAGLRSMETADELGHVRLSILAGAQLAKIYLDLGELEQASLTASETSSQAEDLQLPFPLNNALDAVGSVQISKGQFLEAIETFHRAAESFKGSDSPLNPWSASIGPSLAYLGAGQFENARAAIEHFVKVATERGIRAYQAAGLRVLGQIEAAVESWEEAQASLIASSDIFEELGSRLDLAKTLYHQAVVYHKTGKTALAREHLVQSRELAEACGANALLEMIESFERKDLA